MVSSLTDNNRGPDELGIMTLLRDGPQLLGKDHVCALLDSFIHQGSNGRHICLVLEPLGISILDVYRSFHGSLPLILVQRVAKHVLQGLQYMHECGVIHTGICFLQVASTSTNWRSPDIKGDNILMTGVAFAEGQTTVDLSTTDLFSTTYKLTDFGSGMFSLSFLLFFIIKKTSSSK